jgi:hypothetical protein
LLLNIFTPTLMIKLIKKYNISPIFIILLMDFAMIAIHILWSQKSTFFHLDFEANLPTVYQGSKILIFSMLIWMTVYNSSVTNLTRKLGLIMASTLFFLGIDELASIHENIDKYMADIFPYIHRYVLKLAEMMDYGGALWVIYYAPFIFIVAIVWMIQLYIILQSQKVSIFTMIFGIGILLIVSVPFVEMINTSSNFIPVIYDRWVILEEGLEMVGVSLLAFGYYKMIKNYTKTTITKK